MCTRPFLTFSRCSNLNLLLGLAGLRAYTLNGFDDILALHGVAENDVLAIKPRAWNGRNEELRAISILTSISHREKVGLGVAKLEVFVGELHSRETVHSPYQI